MHISFRWMSEKMDGVRAYWNREKLISRQGKPITPSGFIESLPKSVELDGELWMGRGTTHSDVMQLLQSKNGDWNRIEYNVFDIPSSRGTVEERMTEMEEMRELLPPHVHIVKNIQRTGNDHPQDYLSSVVAAKGEGVRSEERRVGKEGKSG